MVIPIARITFVTMAMPIAMVMLGDLCPSQAAQSGELRPCCDTFNTYYGLFESLAIPYRLTNILATFQNYINNILALH
jgi:hypothetical protein